MEIPKFYRKFLIALKKGIQATKAGEAGFKVSADGCYFNANTTIGESFKMISDAITILNRARMNTGLTCNLSAL